MINSHFECNHREENPRVASVLSLSWLPKFMLHDADLLEYVTFPLKFRQCPSLISTNFMLSVVTMESITKTIIWSIMVCAYYHASTIWCHLVALWLFWCYESMPRYSCNGKVMYWCLLRMYPWHWQWSIVFVLHLYVVRHFFFIWHYLLFPCSEIIPLFCIFLFLPSCTILSELGDILINVNISTLSTSHRRFC